MPPTSLLLPIADHLWQSTLLAALSGLLTLMLRKHHARVRHSVWLAASCKFLIPFSLLITLGEQVRWRTVVELPQSNIKVVSSASQRFAVPVFSAPAPASVPHTSRPVGLVLFAVWACGFAGIGCAWSVRWRKIRTAVLAGTPVEIGAPIPARSSATLVEPGVFGLLRPVLMLPDGIFERLTPAQLRAVIAHELCHVRHRDNLAAAVHMLVEAVFWFHPLVWWIGKRMVEERERACDEEVVQLGTDPREYAEGILNVCKLYIESPLVCVSGVTGSNLRRRIEAILTHRCVYRLTCAKKAVLTAAAIAAMLIPVAIGVINAPPVQAQPARASRPKFEVASIRRCKDESDLRRGGGNSSPGRLSTGCDLLVDGDNNLGLIQRAYVRFAGGRMNPLGILPIEGGPNWIRSELYEINARAEGSPSVALMQGPMLQALLEDRFKLKIRRETREGPVYALMPAKGGPKLKPFEEASCTQMPLIVPPPALPTGQRYCKSMITLLAPSAIAEGSTLGEFSKLLNLALDRPVIDRTGITGRFDIRLEFSPEGLPKMRGPAPDGPAAAPDPARPSIFVAVEEQLGLKLVPAKGPVERLVIDHIERPSEN